MPAPKMHGDEVDIDSSLVHQLLLAQLPHLSELPVEPVQSTGTVNAIFRLGDELCVRLPRVERWASGLARELEWLPKLTPKLSLRVPEPVARGEPGSGYPFQWAVYRWLDGDTYASDRVRDECQAATTLATFVAELRRIDPVGGPPSGRRPLRELDRRTRGAIAALDAVLDTDAVTTAWERCLQAPVWDGRPVWRHCDLLPPNLLVANGQLTAVLDFGSVGIGDPAIDLIPAWSVFGARGRAVFRDALAADTGAWSRAQGFALHQALLIIPYYPATNPDFVAKAKRTVQEVIADMGL